jgi:RNA polymerase sigma-70 factor (ECF subfamily)
MTIPYDDEPELVERARRGDQEAFTQLMERSAAASKRLAASILRDSVAAEDAVQDALSRAWQHVPDCNGDSRFSTWLTRIVVNQCLMVLRGRRRRPTVTLEPAPDSSARLEPVDCGRSPERALGDDQMAEVVRREVGRLPRLLREPLQMRDIEERPIEEIARTLDLSIPAVKSRLLRARAEIRRRLLPHMPASISAPTPRPA